MDSQQKYELGLATVSNRGVLFNGLVYTCSNMIKQKWFEHATKGEWKVIILHDPQNPTDILLFEIQAIEIATTVQAPLVDDQTLQYQSAIRALKEQLSRAKGGIET
ncbi:Mu transposase C-terminal domain-containing protein [Paenibacillus glycanilyticus]|uniref:Mu transposase C-terminal domain-containing protein n=1 Tax=Paenibacillus glycanilyticus TaxID=126569 RepID=UPI00203FC510|nr:Mu transposase C-terminal domain-containing protein [Paenibacillus glycanilyticus]MCM3625774.1 Mu transposase C-terminal domain-containing protein [Paenibacillus glycanilyticus]